jgi:hypothetical protein
LDNPLHVVLNKSKLAYRIYVILIVNKEFKKNLLGKLYHVILLKDEVCNQHRHLVGISRIMKLQGPCPLPPSNFPYTSHHPGFATSGKESQGQQAIHRRPHQLPPF